jgi:hypothetical protein
VISSRHASFCVQTVRKCTLELKRFVENVLTVKETVPQGMGGIYNGGIKKDSCIDSTSVVFIYVDYLLPSTPSSHHSFSNPDIIMKFRTIITVSLAGYVTATPVIIDAEPAIIVRRTVGMCLSIPHAEGY